MAKNGYKDNSGKILNTTERQAISKLLKLHQPMIKEMDKWREQREKLENALLNQIDRMGKFLEPYADQSGLQETLMGLTGQKQPKARPSAKKATSRSSKQTKSRAKKSR